MSLSCLDLSLLRVTHIRIERRTFVLFFFSSAALCHFVAHSRARAFCSLRCIYAPFCAREREKERARERETNGLARVRSASLAEGCIKRLDKAALWSRECAAAAAAAERYGVECGLSKSRCVRGGEATFSA